MRAGAGEGATACGHLHAEFRLSILWRRGFPAHKYNSVLGCPKKKRKRELLTPCSEACETQACWRGCLGLNVRRRRTSLRPQGGGSQTRRLSAGRSY